MGNARAHLKRRELGREESDYQPECIAVDPGRVRTYIRIVIPDFSKVALPIEWAITHGASKEPIALIRKLQLGAGRTTYYRAITWHADRTKRELIGYWGSLNEATQNVYGLYERKLPPQYLALSGSTWREPLPLTKPKMPPAS